MPKVVMEILLSFWQPMEDRLALLGCYSNIQTSPFTSRSAFYDPNMVSDDMSQPYDT